MSSFMETFIDNIKLKDALISRGWKHEDMELRTIVFYPGENTFDERKCIHVLDEVTLSEFKEALVGMEFSEGKIVGARSDSIRIILKLSKK